MVLWGIRPPDPPEMAEMAEMLKLRHFELQGLSTQEGNEGCFC